MQHFPVPENSKNFNPANFVDASTLEDIEDPYWYNPDTQDDEIDKNSLLTLPDDIPYIQRSIQNLRRLKTTSGISVKQAILIYETNTISAIIVRRNKKYA